MPARKPSAAPLKASKKTSLSPLAKDIIAGLDEAAAHFRGERKLTVKRFERRG